MELVGSSADSVRRTADPVRGRPVHEVHRHRRIRYGIVLVAVSVLPFVACAAPEQPLALHPIPWTVQPGGDDQFWCVLGAVSTTVVGYYGYRELAADPTGNPLALYVYTLTETAGAAATTQSCLVWWRDVFDDWVYYTCGGSQPQIYGFKPKSDPHRGVSESSGDFVARWFGTFICTDGGAFAPVYH